MCLTGNCASPDVLACPSSTSSPFSFVYTFANSDRYEMTGEFVATNAFYPTSGGNFQINASSLLVTFLGNSTANISGADTMVVDFLQLFESPIAVTNNSASEAISGTFGGPLANATRVQGQFITGGTASARVLGPFFPPGTFSDSESNEPRRITSPTVLLDFKDTLTFGAGPGVGAFISLNNVPSSVPEPYTWSLTALAFAGKSFIGRRNRRAAK